ncbi:acyl-CoA dehydratase activase [Desulfotomaculum copahuensis]|uniref:CoA activase n=1 Tax=Desulfotomaculum copahuensis TaxID=1838280 RepID=A0A1B7LGN8_9FIRM|nr:acyl-CoA dehydratase activase [Desulfotomaculum copahuensis]OAT85272.1 CoA activase [Desulfotomaculum copahuensis]
MITAGVDVGNKFTKVVILGDGRVLAKSAVLSGFDQAAASEEAMAAALDKAGIGRDDVQHITATGAGKNEVPFARSTVTEVGAGARGALYLFPAARTVVDVGAEEGRALKCNEQGKIVDFAINEKCAAGAGSFTEAMARALEIAVEEMGPLSLQSTRAVPMNAQCAVFAESEVVSLIHAKTPKEDIAHAVHDAIASRVISMVRRVGLEKDLALIGGLAYNAGFVRSMEEGLEVKAQVPEDPEYVTALGAALVAAEKAGEEA